MKLKSNTLTLAAATLGLAIIAPTVEAGPRSKNHGLPSLLERQRDQQSTQATSATPKTIGLMAGCDTKLRFKRKVGGPAQAAKVEQVCRTGEPSTQSGHLHPKVGGRQSHTSH